MNLSLLDPFVLAQDCPEAWIGSLHSGHSTCIRFNKRGDYLASGRADGNVIIFDTDTNGVARKLVRGHTRQVQSVSWSTDSRFLLSASQDWKCVLWDLKDGSKVRTVKLESPVFIAEIHPQNHLLFIAALYENEPVLVDISEEVTKKTTLSSLPKRTDVVRENGTEKKSTQEHKHHATVIIFSRSGKHIIAGTNKGWLNLIDTETCETLFSTRVTNHILTLLQLTASGREMVVNSSDRIIRTLHLPDLDDPTLDFDQFKIDVEHKFQDIVNRLSWNHVTFSSTGEYVVASIYMNHYLYVWERGRGSLEKILEGPKEELSVVEWHPHKPFIAASGVDSGRVFLWSITTPQRWSALAPDFAEVEENVEYVEREDEFDIHPIEEIHKRILHQEDEDIDVLTIEPGKNGVEEGDFQMPVLLDIEDSDSDDDIVAVGAGQYRRKSPGQGREWMMEEEATGTGSDPGTPKKNASSKGTGNKRRRVENEA